MLGPRRSSSFFLSLSCAHSRQQLLDTASSGRACRTLGVGLFLTSRSALSSCFVFAQPGSHEPTSRCPPPAWQQHVPAEERLDAPSSFPRPRVAARGPPCPSNPPLVSRPPVLLCGPRCLRVACELGQWTHQTCTALSLLFLYLVIVPDLCLYQMQLLLLVQLLRLFWERDPQV